MLPTFFRTLPLSRISWSNFGWHLYINKSYVPIILSVLKVHRDCEYKNFVDIVAIDSLLLRSSISNRFSVKYLLLSCRYQRRVSLSIDFGLANRIYSVTNIFPRAGWSEREIWDLFGIQFIGHVDLRRILTDYGFRGHPLLKDYPLSGFKEVIYSESRKRVTFKPVQLTQSYRRFVSDSPWVFYLYNFL